MPHIEHADVASFLVNHVNLPSDEAKKHRKQVNGLRDRLADKIAADPDYGLVKSLHAGSVAKGTALKTVNDLDLAVYVEKAQAPDGDAELVTWLADRLFDATTNMDRGQFEEQDHCVTVNYKGSGLSVDVVPVLYEGEAGDIGYLVKKRSGDRLKTSIPLHLNFISSRKGNHGQGFTELIRATKWWKRNIANRVDEDFKFKSFMIELIWAHLVDEGLALDDYTEALEAFFKYILLTELDERITFTDYTPASTLPPSR